MDDKKICITGTNNRYMMKKATKEPVVEKKTGGKCGIKFYKSIRFDIWTNEPSG